MPENYYLNIIFLKHELVYFFFIAAKIALLLSVTEIARSVLLREKYRTSHGNLTAHTIQSNFYVKSLSNMYYGTKSQFNDRNEK